LFVINTLKAYAVAPLVTRNCSLFTYRYCNSSRVSNRFK